MDERQEESGEKGFLERGVMRLEQGCTFIASLSFVVMLGIIVVGTLARYFFNYPFSFVDEYSGYLLVVMGFLGMAAALRRDAHITVDIVTNALPKKVRHWLDIGAHCLAVIIAAVLFWISMKLAWENYSTHLLSSTIMETPLWIPQVFIPIGWAAFILFVFVRIKRKVRRIGRS
jgi:TRAP-type C4-dicarboxylate transport system permease small subunit